MKKVAKDRDDIVYEMMRVERYTHSHVLQIESAHQFTRTIESSPFCVHACIFLNVCLWTKAPTEKIVDKIFFRMFAA